MYVGGEFQWILRALGHIEVVRKREEGMGGECLSASATFWRDGIRSEVNVL